MCLESFYFLNEFRTFFPEKNGTRLLLGLHWICSCCAPIPMASAISQEHLEALDEIQRYFLKQIESSLHDKMSQLVKGAYSLKTGVQFQEPT